MSNADSRRAARRIQYAIAAVFFVLGGWCLLFPQSVIALGVRPEYRTDHPLAVLAFGAFGAQAILAGIFAGFSVFTRLTFLIYAIALLPFFVFDWWVYFREPIVNEVIFLDAAGNAIMLALCVIGYRLLSKAES